MSSVVRFEEDFDKNPPDFLALSGVYNVVVRGCGFCGVLAKPADESFSRFEYKIYVMGMSSDGSLARRAADVASILEVPEFEQGGTLKDRAAYGRIRSFDSPTGDPLMTSCYINSDAKMLAVSVAREMHLLANPKNASPYERSERQRWVSSGQKGSEYKPPDLDLKHVAFSFFDDREKLEEVRQWMDCLYSAITSKRAAFPEQGKDYEETVIESLKNVDFAQNGSLINADPVLMSLLFSIGRAEWLTIQGRAPIQREIQRRRDAAIDRGQAVE